jgi:predicted Rossmann-fold nucleotide-binding protein
MEAVSSGAAAAGGRVIGVTAPAVFPGRDAPNPHLTEELRAASLSERIHELIDLAAASIALHGSIGTATELLVAWNLAYVAQFSGQEPDPVVAVGERWREIVTTLANTLDTDPGYVTCVATVDDAVTHVVARLRS